MSIVNQREKNGKIAHQMRLRMKIDFANTYKLLIIFYIHCTVNERLCLAVLFYAGIWHDTTVGA